MQVQVYGGEAEMACKALKIPAAYSTNGVLLKQTVW